MAAVVVIVTAVKAAVAVSCGVDGGSYSGGGGGIAQHLQEGVDVCRLHHRKIPIDARGGAILFTIATIAVRSSGHHRRLVRRRADIEAFEEWSE